MENAPELVTVYRSMDETAKEDCDTIAQILVAEGLSPVIVDDQAPGVPEGVFEVRVPASEAAGAEESIAANPLPGEIHDLDNAHELDLESIFHSEGANTGELEANSVKNVLDAAGIAAVIVGDSVLPNLPFEVKVAREHAYAAREIVAEALASGPAAADEAELQTERGGVVEP